MAVVPASRQALAEAGLEVKDMGAVQTHNPFAVNEVYMARELGIDLESMNTYGSSLVYGHPQGPTGMRGVIELIETLVARGGGHGLHRPHRRDCLRTWRRGAPFRVERQFLRRPKRITQARDGRLDHLA